MKQLGNKNSENLYWKVDYIRIKTKEGTKKEYMLNYPCFGRLVMNEDSQEPETVRSYFVKLRQFLVKYQSGYGKYQMVLLIFVLMMIILLDTLVKMIVWK